MNKKDLAELKKHFNASDDLMIIQKVFTCFTDAEKNRRCQSVRSFTEIPDEEMSVLFQTLTKVLKGSLGKGLVEYA